MARGGQTYSQLDTSFRRRDFAPLYFLYGGEGYLIDLLQETLLQHALEPGERDFNLDIIYGAEVEAQQALASLQRVSRDGGSSARHRARLRENEGEYALQVVRGATQSDGGCGACLPGASESERASVQGIKGKGRLGRD